MAGLLGDSDIMQHFVYHPQNAFNNSTASENGVLKTGCLFVALAVFSDGSPIDKQMKHSEHPFLLTMLNLTLE
jgi:hypothetical protein